VVVSIIKESSFVVHCCLPAIFALLLQNAGRLLCVVAFMLRVARFTACTATLLFFSVCEKKKRKAERRRLGEVGE
jgi:hypothetical protein